MTQTLQELINEKANSELPEDEITALIPNYIKVERAITF